MRRAILGAALFMLVAPVRAGEPANTLEALFQALQSCVGPVALPRGTDVTVQFSLNRRGGLIGKPRLTHAHWEGDEAARKTAAAGIAAAFDRCLPLPITDGLGGAIAGRQLLLRMRGEAPERKA